MEKLKTVKTKLINYAMMIPILSLLVASFIITHSQDVLANGTTTGK